MDCPPTHGLPPTSVPPQDSQTGFLSAWRGEAKSEPTWALSRMEQLQRALAVAEKGSSSPRPAPGTMARVVLGNARLGPRGQPSAHTPTEGILHLAAGGLSQVCFRIPRESSPETSRASPPQCPARLRSRGPSPARSLPCVTPSERGPLPCWSPHLISVPPPHWVCSGGRPGPGTASEGEASRGKARSREGWVGKGHLL